MRLGRSEVTTMSEKELEGSEKIRILTEALEYYSQYMCAPQSFWRKWVIEDDGKKAREALKQIKENQNELQRTTTKSK